MLYIGEMFFVRFTQQKAKVIIMNNINIDYLTSCVIYNDLAKLLSIVPFQYSLIKGKALSLQAYNNTSSRKSGDVDILITKKDVCTFENILRSHGYVCTDEKRANRVFCLNSSHQILPYVKNQSGVKIEVDVNFDIFWGEYSGTRIDISRFLSDVQEIDLYGHKIKTLTPLKSLIQLILHHYKDMNSIFLLATRKSIKYDMFKDVFFLIKNNLDTITLDNLYALSLEYEIIPYVFYVLYYTGQLFNDEIIWEYTEAFRTPVGESLLGLYGLNSNEQKEWKCDFKTRLESNNLYDLIKDDLSADDREKIDINCNIFLGRTK